MAVFLLVRHGNNDMVDRGSLAGRMPGVHLNEEGRAQAERLAERLGKVPIDMICSSPMERTRETAAPIAERLGLEVRVLEGVNEFKLGEWTGCNYEELVHIPKWRQFNSFRTGARVPGGELILEVQARMVTTLEHLREELPDGVIAVFSHGDPIKTAVAYYAGMPLDFVLRMEISPASISIIAVNDHGPRILCVNHTEELPRF